MFEINFNKTMQDLTSDDYEVQCIALNSIIDLNEAIVEQAIKGFETSEAPDLMIERLANLGLTVRKKLEEFISTSEKNEKRVLASIALLFLGSEKGIQDVTAEVLNQGKHEILAVRKLVQAQILGTDDLIIERLRKFSLEELKDEEKSHYVNTLLICLEELSVSLPEDLKKSFEKISKSQIYKYYALPK